MGRAIEAAKKLIVGDGHVTRGDAVKWVQGRVGAQVDGVWGPRTRDAVKRWQRANGLVGDGVVGPATWARMF